MTEEAQRIAIAEACGVQTQFFRFLIPYHDGAKKWRDLFETRKEAEEARFRCGKWVLSDVEEYTDLRRVPNFLNDLNAMHEAEKVLLDREIGSRFRLELCKNSDGPNSMFMTVEAAMCHATASQRAEAFLRTLNLWNDSK